MLRCLHNQATKGNNEMTTYEPTTTETRSLGSQGEVHLVEVVRTWNYPAGDVTLRHYEVETADGTRSKHYQHYANALKAWSKAFNTGKVAK